MFTFIFQLILFVSLFRSTGKRFDVAYGARGCLASGVCILLGVAVLMASFSLGLTNWLDLIPVKAKNGLGMLMWFLCLCLGGYVAARLGRTTGWTNSLIVGIFYVIFLLTMLLDNLIKPDWPEFTPNPLLPIFEKPLAYWGRLPVRLFDHLIEMLQEPLTNWGQLAGLFFAIPAAVLGGFLWQRSHPTLPPNTVPHKPATLMNTILGLRFSILGLAFLCMLVLAIVFRNDPAAVKAIKDRGGSVKGEPVVSVAFPGSASVSDADLTVLKELTSLKTLNLDSTKITDGGLKELKGLASLESLTLSNTAVTDAGLKELKPLTKLRTLTLSGTEVTDEGLKELKGFYSLQSLNLSGTEVTDEGLRELKGFASLQSLNLSGTKITDEGLKELKGFASWQSLNLSGTEVTDEGLKELKRFNMLQSLNLRGTKITDAGIKQFKVSNPGTIIVK
jgi:hypothetical protein